MRRLMVLFRPHRRVLLVASALMATTTAAQLAGPLLIRRAIDVAIPGRSVSGLLACVSGYLLLQVAFLVLDWWKKVRLETMGQDIILELRERIFAHLLDQPLAFFDANPPGKLISRLQSDTDALRQLFAATVVTLVEAVVLLAGMLGVMATISPGLTLVVAAMIPIMGAAAWLVASGGALRFREVRVRAAELSGWIAERIAGIQLVQAYGREEATVAGMERLNRAKFRSSLKAEFYELGLFHGLLSLETLGIGAVLWLGGRWVLGGTLTVGTLVLFIEYLRRLFDPISRVSEQLDVMQRATAAAGRVFDLLDLAPALRDPDRPQPWTRFEREIEFRDVRLSYGRPGEWALAGVSFRMPAGETWAIVGPTGSGKSSLLSLLLRFYDPQSGQVLVDGLDLRTIAQRDLRSKMALVLQDVFLFPGDVLSNILPPGKDRDRAEAAAFVAARLAGAEEFVSRLPAGYRTPLAERGANLSAGERQLLALARALAADPQILLLDEATAAVDPQTEARIQQGLTALLRGRTAIVIAHRLSTVRHADRILVLQQGRIVESGRHEELLERGGVYADLHALQFQTDIDRPPRAAPEGSAS
jgi:ATP-binding cassette subfamily B protein